MKTYHEMTESVLQKAGAEILKKERRRRNLVCITASGLCLALLLTVLGMGMEQTPVVSPTQPKQPALSVDAAKDTQPTDVTEVPKPTDPIDETQPIQQGNTKVFLLTSTDGQETFEPVSADVSFPLYSNIKIRDVRGLTDAELEKALEEEDAMLNGSKFIHYIGGDKDGFVTTMGSRNAIWTVTHKGKLTLDFSDCPRLLNVDIQTTEVGNVGLSRRLTEDYPEVINQNHWPYTLKASLNWSVSDRYAHEFEKNSEYHLETLRDTITVTIYYENGATETLIFDITVNEEGQIFVTQRGIPTEAA